MDRMVVTKTPKCYVGGVFIRSEGNLTYPICDEGGAFFANIPLCTRKDVRNAVEAAAKAIGGWAGRSAYNRGQIIYRLGEMLEGRKGELEAAMFPGDEAEKKGVKAEAAAAVDRVIYYAGWTDKYQGLLGSVNPVATEHFNFSTTEAMGVVAIAAPEGVPLLGLLSMILPVIVSGNAVVVLASETRPYPAILLGEMLATSDLPGGVVNILTGKRSDILPTFATHEHVRAVYATVDREEREMLQKGAANSLKRCAFISSEEAYDWSGADAQGLYQIRNFLELKTSWHPIG